jgi:hypothetical protein
MGNLIDIQAVKKFSTFYGNKYITIFTKAYQGSQY